MSMLHVRQYILSIKGLKNIFGVTWDIPFVCFQHLTMQPLENDLQIWDKTQLALSKYPSYTLYLFTLPIFCSHLAISVRSLLKACVCV